MSLATFAHTQNAQSAPPVSRLTRVSEDAYNASTDHQTTDYEYLSCPRETCSPRSLSPRKRACLSAASPRGRVIEVSDHSFGALVAYLIPGFLVLLALAATHLLHLKAYWAMHRSAPKPQSAAVDAIIVGEGAR